LSERATVNKLSNFGREHKGVTFSFDAELLLDVTQKVSEINMEEVTFDLVDHNIVRMTISKAEDIAGHTIASCRLGKYLTNLLQLFGRHLVESLLSIFLVEDEIILFFLLGQKLLHAFPCLVGEIFSDGVILEGVEDVALVTYELQAALVLHVSKGDSVRNKFKEALHTVGSNYFIRSHLEVKVMIQPYFVDD